MPKERDRSSSGSSSSEADVPEKQQTPDLIEAALELAEKGDRWFVSLARKVGKTARWASGSASVVADTMTDAAGNAATVTRKVANQVLPAVRRSKLPQEAGAALEELGTLAAKYAGKSYGRLRQSGRFWQLIDRIQELRDSAGAAPAETEEVPVTEEAADTGEDPEPTTAAAAGAASAARPKRKTASRSTHSPEGSPRSKAASKRGTGSRKKAKKPE